MTVLWPIALMTFKEGIRNRIFYSVFLFALLLIGINFIIASMIPHDVGKVAVDMVLSAVSFTGLLLVLFIGINLLSQDLEKRTIYVVLSKPISRPQYVVGKFIGMALLILAALFMLNTFAVLSLVALKMIYPSSFQSFSWVSVFLALLLIILMLNMLSALSFLFSSFTSSSFTTLILTIISYVIGQSLTAVKTIIDSPQTLGLQFSSLTVKTVQAAYYVFPNLSFFDIKTQAAHGLSVSSSYIVWTISYGVVYTCIVVTLAALIFRKKEFP